MKKKIFSVQHILLSAFFIFLLNACKKDTVTTPQEETQYGGLMLHLHSNADTNEIEYDSLYYMAGGRKIIVTKAQLFISGIVLTKTDGSIYSIPDSIILKRQEIEPYTLGNVPAGEYQSIRFNVGLSPSVNASTPSPSNATLNQPGMWFDSTNAQPSGFVFADFRGLIDTTAAASASVSQMVPFIIRIGTNANLKSVTLNSEHFTVDADQMLMLHMTIDYAMLLDGLTLQQNSNLNILSPADNAGTAAQQVTNNIPMIFSYEM